MSTTLSIDPLIFHGCREASSVRLFRSKRFANCSFSHSKCSVFNGRRLFCNCKSPRRPFHVRASSSSTKTAMAETFDSCDLVFNHTFPLNQTTKVEGKICIKLNDVKDGIVKRKLFIGCDLPGKWILHWGVSYIGDVGNEWDQPTEDMIPPESIRIKDYAIETPLKKLSSSSEGDTLQGVEIDCDPKSAITAINFVLRDEETGAWYQHKGRDFKVPLINGQKKGSTKWPGPLGQLSSMFLQTEALGSVDEDGELGLDIGPLERFQEELPIVKEVAVCSSITVSVRKCPDSASSLLYMETDLPGNVIIHWGVCRDDENKWEIPDSTPPRTLVFKRKALRTVLQPKEDGTGSSGLFTLDEKYKGFLFVLKQDGNTWLNCMGNDFYVPLPKPSISIAVPEGDQLEKKDLSVSTALPEDDQSGKEKATKNSSGENDNSLSDYANGVLHEIKSLMTDISDKTTQEAKNKEAQEKVLQEIERLAAEAYSIFNRSKVSTPPKEVESVEGSDVLYASPTISSGTGTGFEILCQGFNWESHKSGRWYMDIKEKAKELSSLGFTTIWLPPPTESVSPEGYMPKDLYNLNSRYGSMEELKEVVKTFREVGMKVLGDVVLNHRCAHYKNENGVWNKFGGRLNWDDRAIVADDPHFQGRGNKSSGDNFHAAPNIDHSQDFVRKDIKEWLCWLRKEVGYDGWRLDFVRGFWGGYVKDYIDASTPYFAVGEYWDSLNYTYGEMDRNQDAHRQRIIDWINATEGKACAFDVTTKGILHAALEKCEYWRLSDEQGKPPGVLGWWPSRAVTFIENHDTGSTQGHWRFPGGKEMQGYAYILTHPGTPSVFYDHIFSNYRSEIAALISIRNRNKINCRSTVKIIKAERDVYAAIINDRVAVKIGPGHYEPHSGAQKWSQALEGRDYKVWVASS